MLNKISLIKKYIATSLIIIVSASSNAQIIDSLKQVLSSSPDDTTYYKSSIDLAWEYMYIDTDTALFHANRGLDKAVELKSPLRIVNADNTIGVCYIVFGDYDKAIEPLEKAREIGESLLVSDSSKYIYKRRLLAVYTNIGNIYYYQANYEKSIENYIRALKLSKEIKYENGASICTSNIGAAYKDLLNYPKALDYEYEALAIAKQIGERYAITQCLNNLGSTYFSLSDYDSAYYYFNKCIKINESENFEHELINNYVNMGDVLRELNKLDSAYYFYDKALAYSRKLKSKDGIINCTYMIGQYFEKNDDYKKALDYYSECLQMSMETGTKRFIMLSQEKMSQIYEQKGDFKNAFIFFKNSSIVKDSIFSKERDENIALMETKYKTSEQAQKIEFLNERAKLLDKNNKTNKLVSVSLSIILLLILSIVWIAFRSFKHKQLAEKIKLKQRAEHDKLNAIVETEHKERKRFAEDLHDGLGVLLSTLRLYINEINTKRNKAERDDLIRQSNKMLDEAILNARNISNNIMPAGLKNNGLELSLRSFCDKINSAANIKINIKTLNLKPFSKESLETTIYKIITELINNTLKHANATTIDITMTRKKQKLFFTYRDNGIGFDYEKTLQSNDKGMGLDNINNRIRSISGKSTIKSKKGEGFFAGFDINL